MKLTLKINCECGEAAVVNLTNECSIQEETEQESSVFSVDQYDPDEIHIQCKTCGDLFHLGT